MEFFKLYKLDEKEVVENIVFLVEDYYGGKLKEGKKEYDVKIILWKILYLIGVLLKNYFYFFIV